MTWSSQHAVNLLVRGRVEPGCLANISAAWSCFFFPPFLGDHLQAEREPLPLRWAWRVPVPGQVALLGGAGLLLHERVATDPLPAWGEASGLRGISVC